MKEIVVVNRTCSMTLAFSLSLAMAATILGCGGTKPSSPPVGPRMSGRSQAPSRSGGPPGPAAKSLPEHLTQLGITGEPSSGSPMGLVVTGFVTSPEPSPLQLMGVEKGDVIVSCNGQQQQIAGRVVTAVRNLQEKGEPVTLVVLRQGKELTLERTEKFPESKPAQGPQ
jgi:S1-C subfamily serine protease